MNKKNNRKQAFINTIKKMLPVISVTIIATILGLVSLLRSKVPMIKNFGIMLTIGLVIAILVVVFVFMPILYVKDKHFPDDENKKKRVTKENLKNNKFVDKFLNGVFKAKYVIIVVAVVLAAVGIGFDIFAPAETNIENFMPQDNQALADIRELRTEVGSTEQIAIVLEGENILTEININTIKEITEDILPAFSDDVLEYESLIALFSNMGFEEVEFINEDNLEMIPKDQRKLFLNANNTITVINLAIDEMCDEQFDVFIDDLYVKLDELDTNLDIKITGQSLINAAMMKAMTNGRYQITIIGLVLIFIVLLIIYRSFRRAILPIIPIILIIGWSGGIMAIFGLSYTPLTATLGSLIMGIGTAYTILINDRYLEEYNETNDKLESIKTSINRMGKPILVSALTTMGGFSALIFSDFVILSNFGIMTVVSFLLALLSSIIVLPAILSIDRKKKKPSRS